MVINLKHEWVESHKNCSITEMAAGLVAARIAKAKLKADMEEENAKYDALVELLVDKMDDEDITRFTIDSGTAAGLSISLLDTPYPKVIDKVGLLNYFDADPNLRKMLSVNYQTLRAFCSEKLTAGESLPPGVDVFIKTSISLRGLSAIGDKDEED